jgi:hypothetical protein
MNAVGLAWISEPDGRIPGALILTGRQGQISAFR